MCWPYVRDEARYVVSGSVFKTLFWKTATAAATGGGGGGGGGGCDAAAALLLLLLRLLLLLPYALHASKTSLYSDPNIKSRDALIS